MQVKLEGGPRDGVWVEVSSVTPPRAVKVPVIGNTEFVDWDHWPLDPYREPPEFSQVLYYRHWWKDANGAVVPRYLYQDDQPLEGTPHTADKPLIVEDK